MYNIENIFPESFSSIASEVEYINNDGWGKFKCKLYDETISGKIKYFKKRKKFVIKSDDLDNLSELKAIKSRFQYPSTFITNRPILRVITERRQLYSGMKFYKPKVNIWGKERADQLGYLKSFRELLDVNTEKGEKGKYGKNVDGINSWQDKSIFQFIDNKILFKKESINPDLLICEDLGTEVCDFLVVDFKKDLIVAIHAKMGDKDKPFSATKFQDVKSQVVKNLGFFNFTGSYLPESKIEKWKRKWKWNKCEKSNLWIPRIRCNNHSSNCEQIYKKVKDMIINSKTSKEIWIILGNSFSVKELNNKLDEENPPYNVVQLIYLMQSCNSDCSSLGVKLKIYTVP